MTILLHLGDSPTAVPAMVLVKKVKSQLKRTDLKIQ